MISVDSSNIDSVGYDSDERTLRVQFHSGRVYDYLNVDQDVYRDLINATSVGSYFNSNIRTFYNYQEV